MTDVMAPHIEMKNGELGPKPRIAGKGITISALATWHEKLGLSVEELVREYNLTRAEVHAGLAYYYDHKEEIEEQIRREDRELAAIASACESPLSKQLKITKDSSPVPDRVRFYTESHIAAAAVEALRRHSADVLTAVQAGMQDATDPQHLACALGEGRVLISRDGDFAGLHRRGVPHAGIIFFPRQRST